VTAVLSVLGLVAVVLLTLGTALFVAAEFSLTTLERSQVDHHAATVGDRKAQYIQRADRCRSSSPAPSWASRSPR